jgi:transcriptional regulator with XRE-family HTH domain
MAALPFCRVSLKCLKPLRFYPLVYDSIGDHLRKKRLDLKLFQKDVAAIIGASEASVNNWEANNALPSIAYMPQIIKFLGYLPYDNTAKTMGGRIRMAREALGLSQEKLACKLGIDPTTIRRWESGKGRPSKGLLERLDRFFSL